MVTFSFGLSTILQLPRVCNALSKKDLIIIFSLAFIPSLLTVTNLFYIAKLQICLATSICF